MNVHNSKRVALALLSLAVVSGCCCQAIPLPDECQCPTDARRLYLTCGEEAVRRCPCGPDHEFYGLKPTCWRAWPEGWHCNGCEGHPYVDRESCGEPVIESPVAEAGTSNPFRSRSGAAELPVPPQASDFAPTQSAPAKNKPLQPVPAQPTPTAPPALEMTPKETAPDVKESTGERSGTPTSVASAPSKTSVATPPFDPIILVQATAPLPMPVVPAAVKMTAAPILISPQNGQPPITEPNAFLPEVQTASSPKAEKEPAEKRTDTSTVKDRDGDPAMSNRVEQHLLNNLRL